MKPLTEKEQLIRNIIEWSSTLSEEEIEGYMKEGSEDHPEEQLKRQGSSLP